MFVKTDPEMPSVLRLNDFHAYTAHLCIQREDLEDSTKRRVGRMWAANGERRNARTPVHHSPRIQPF